MYEMSESNLESSPGCSRSGFVIPKIADEQLFRDVDLNSKEWTLELYPLLKRNFKLPGSEQKFIINNVKLVRNKKLTQRYREKKEEMSREKEIEQDVVYIGSNKPSICHKICSEGVRTGNVQFTHLGIAKMGVVVHRHPDVLWTHKLDSKATYYLIMLKIIPGKIKYVADDSSNLEPTPGFDCHLTKPKTLTSNTNFINHKQLYANSQMYLYEYERDGISTRPRQISPVGIIEFRFADPTQPVNIPAKLNAAISTTPKTITVRTTVTVWTGELYNNETKIAKVHLVSHGMAFKPIALGKKINLTASLSASEMKDRYLKNINKLSVKQEFHNGQFYLSYFQLLCQEASPGFDQFISYLETTGKAAVWCCGNRVEGVVASPKTLGLTVMSTQYSEKGLCCFFASPHSLQSRITLARAKLACAKTPTDTMIATQKGPMTATNFDEAFSSGQPFECILRVHKLEEAFLKQLIDFERRNPDFKASAAATLPPLLEKVVPKRPTLFATPNEQVLRPAVSKLDPRLRQQNIASPLIESPKATNMAITSPNISQDAPPKVKTPPPVKTHEETNIDISRWDTNSTPYSPTQFSPIGEDNGNDDDYNLYFEDPPMSKEAETKIIEPVNIVQKTVLKSAPENVVAIEKTVPKYDGQKHLSQLSNIAMGKRGATPTDDNFFEKVGQFQSSRSFDMLIPFLDESSRPSTNTYAEILKMTGQKEQQTTNNVGEQPVTYGSIHSVDAMKSYLNASINKLKTCEPKRFDSTDETVSDKLSANTQTSPTDQSILPSTFTSTAETSNSMTRNVAIQPSELKENRASNAQAAAINQIKRVSTDNTSAVNKRIKPSYENENSMQPAHSVRPITVEKLTVNKQDPRLAMKLAETIRSNVGMSLGTVVVVKPEIEKEIDKTVKNAISEFEETELKAVKSSCSKEKDLVLLSWGKEETVKSNKPIEEVNCNEDWRLNPFKLSSFTTIYNQEVKTEKSDEKVNAIKDNVLGFTDELMKKFENARKDDEKEESEESPFSDQENCDKTFGTLNEEMESFYKILSDVIPVDDHIRSVLQKKLNRNKPQVGGLLKLKCIANTLTESLSDKYLNCILKCELKKFVLLVENIFSTLFIISESHNLAKDESTKDAIKERYNAFQKSLHRMMAHYGLAEEGSCKLKENELSKFSILEKLTHSNVYVDAILNEKRHELSNILDEITHNETYKRNKKNGINSKSSRSSKRLRVTTNGASNDKEMILHLESESDSNRASDRYEVMIKSMQTSTPMTNYEPTSDDYLEASEIEHRKFENRKKSRKSQCVARRIKKIVKRKTIGRMDPNRCYAQLRRCLVKYKHLKENEREIANESHANDVLHRSIQRHCEGRPAHRPMRISKKQRQLRNTLTHLGSALSQMCNGGPSQMRRLLSSQGLNLSAALKELADDIQDAARPRSRTGSRAFARRSNSSRVIKNVNSDDKDEASQDTLLLPKDDNMDEQEELYDSLPDAVKNGASVIFSDLLHEQTPQDEGYTTNEWVNTQENDVNTNTTAVCVPTYQPNPSYYEDNYEQEEPADITNAHRNEMLINPAYETNMYEQPLLPTVDTLYFVYGNAINECNNVKDYLNAMGHRPYGSNNKETVAAAENGIVLYVFVHSGIEDEPHLVPDLLSLKQLPNSHFMLFDNVNDLQSQSCRMIFEKGGLIVPDAKVLLNASPGILTHVFSLIKKKQELEIAWHLYVHSHVIQQLESSSESRGLREHSTSSARASGLLNILKVRECERVHIMDSHECDVEASTKNTLKCLRDIQRQNMTSYRHIVFVSDLPSTDPILFEFQQCGISVMPLIELINRHLITNSDSTAANKAE